LILLAATAATFLLVACGGGGGGGGSGSQEDPNNITITGVVNGGGDNASIPNAECRFVDTDGQRHDSDTCDADGVYRLSVPPAVRGYILCSPQSMPNLNLSTFSSTINSAPGTTITSENITPITTLAADIMRYEKPADPETRKAELLYTIATGEDPTLGIVATMAVRLYQTMLARQVNVEFGAERSGSGDGGDGGDGRSDGGGVGGDAGDGADFSPLLQAECTFVVGDGLATARPFYPPALADYWGDGRLNRPDLRDLEDEVHEGLELTPEEIQDAFAEVFRQGPGQPISALADDQGHYFLPIPANVDGYVRCSPQGDEKLVLGTYVPARKEGEIHDDADVTPATTVFGTHIASQMKRDLATIKENFLTDVDGLKTLLSGPNLPEGPLTGINLGTDTTPANSEVGLVAFSVTALFNALYKNGYDVDFAATIADLTAKHRLDPAFLEAQGVPANQTQALADLVNDAIGTAETDLSTDLATALSTARVNMTVMADAAGGGGPISGAVVDIQDCEGEACSFETDALGQVTLTLSAIPETATAIDLTVSSAPEFEPVTVTTEVVALATVEVAIALSAQSGTISGAVMDGLADTPLAGARVSVFNEGQIIASDTTDSQGNYALQCPIGSDYTLSIEMDGYLPTQYTEVAVSADSPTFLETTLLVNRLYSGKGAISGTIRSALNNQGVEGVSLELRKGINNRSGDPLATAITTADGAYQFSAIRAGVYTVSASHDDYDPTSFTVLCAGGRTLGNQDGSMSPELAPGEIRIVLRWGAAPADLDAHLTGPSSEGGSFHCYYGDQSPDPAGYVQLDLDDRYGYGPETTTILQPQPGTYRYWVHDYSNRGSTTSTALSDAGAQVRVYDDSGELASFNVPPGQDGTVWTVFALDGASGQITPLNTISDDSEPESVRPLLGENPAAQFTESRLFEDLPEK
jgi:hypothetical protein